MTQEEIDQANRRAYEDRTIEMIQTRNKAIASLEQQLATCRSALLLIEEWQLPYPGFSWENGSNGERDHFRRVARNALGWKPV